MANQRMCIRCLGCGKDEIYIAKRMRDGFYTADCMNIADSLNHRLDEWFDLHKACGGTEDHFAIGYEEAENYDSLRKDPLR